MFSHHDTTEEDLRRGACRDSTAHVVREEGEADLVCGCKARARGQDWRRETREAGRTIHPAKPFAGHHLEIDALITVLCIDQVREPDRVKLLGNNAVEVDKCSCHPNVDNKDIKKNSCKWYKRTCIRNDRQGAEHLQDSHTARVLPRPLSGVVAFREVSDEVNVID